MKDNTGKKRHRTFKGHMKFAHRGLREPLKVVRYYIWKTGKYDPRTEDIKHYV